MEGENLPSVRIRGLPAAMAAIAVVFLLSALGIRPPAPKPASVPADEFSAQRARDVLFQLVGDGVPHPIGSHQNDLVRQRIVDQFTRLGYDPQVQAAFECDEYGTCGTVNNALARLDGAEKGAAVLLAAHYDSVPAGPGASDDGVGAAAVLEIARALKSLPQPRHSVVLMIDDGEEAGLLGARAFVDSHPWAKEVRAAVNLEARGTSGPSLMFETGSANDWVVRLFAQNAPRPATTSVSYALYKLLPNDTDFTVFKAAGYQGLNFAFVGDVTHYHTPLDNFHNASPRSLQHQGDNALRSIVALANTDLQPASQGDAVYFDLLGRWVVRWPARTSLLLSLFATVLIASQTFWLIRTNRLTSRQLLSGVIAWITAILATAILESILLRVVRIADGIPVNWIAHPLPLLIAVWSLLLALTLIVGAAFVRYAGFWGLWSGMWAWMALLSLVTSLLMPGVSYIPLAGSIVSALAALPFTARRSGYETGSTIAVILPLIASCAAGFELAILLYDVLGTRFLIAVAQLALVLLLPMIPLCADLLRARRFARTLVLGVPILATLGATLTACVVPAFSQKAPERMNIDYWLDADSARGRWVIHPDSGHLPEAIRLGAKFQRIERGPFPWDRGVAFVAEAPRLELAAPTFTILESSVAGNKRSYRALLRSERSAPVAAVLFPPNSGVESVSMEDLAIPPQSERLRTMLNGWSLYRCDTMPAKGVTINFALPVGTPIAVYAIDRSFSLPDDGNFLLKARPLTTTPSQDGDVSLVSRRVQLIP